MSHVAINTQAHQRRHRAATATRGVKPPGSTFSLRILFAGVSLLALCFGVMHYSQDLGIAALISAALAFTRAKLHRFTAWRSGWRIDSDRIFGVLLLSPLICIPIGIFAFRCAALGLMSLACENWAMFHGMIEITGCVPDIFYWAAAVALIAFAQAGEILIALFFSK